MNELVWEKVEYGGSTNVYISQLGQFKISVIEELTANGLYYRFGMEATFSFSVEMEYHTKDMRKLEVESAEIALQEAEKLAKSIIKEMKNILEFTEAKYESIENR